MAVLACLRLCRRIGIAGRGRGDLNAAAAAAAVTAAAGHSIVQRRWGAAAAADAAAVLFLGLHAPILKPDLDLSLGEAEAGGQLEPARPTQVAVVVVLLLQLHQLPGPELGPRPLRADGGRRRGQGLIRDRRTRAGAVAARAAAAAERTAAAVRAVVVGCC